MSTREVIAEFTRHEHPETVPQDVKPEEDARVWSVGDLVRQVRGLVEQRYASVSVEGEISNWRPAASGHCYFTLKDREAQLSVVMFRRQASLLRFRPKDGDAVRLTGQLSIYENRGQMQLIAEWMQQVGLGAMLAAVRELKEKLRREGLFDRKRPLPEFPKCIGVVTSLQGAALRDIVKVCRRRHAAVRLLIYPAAVQGPRCAIEVAAGVWWFSQHKDQADVIMVARGGGSWEDLHGFDDEMLARTIAACELPVIVGVGHATDTTIADAVADICAPTPSAAAELVTAAQFRIEERVERLHARVERAGRYELLRAHRKYANLRIEESLKRVEQGVKKRQQRLDELEFAVRQAPAHQLREAMQRVTYIDSRLQRCNPDTRLGQYRSKIENLSIRLFAGRDIGLRAAQTKVERADLQLNALNPLAVLERGYALVYNEDGVLLRSSENTTEGETIVARLARGKLQATVTGKQ